MEEKRQHSNNFMKIVIGMGLLIGVVALYLLLSIETPKKPLAGKGYNNEPNIEIGGDFELIDQEGEIFNSKRLNGKLSLIYFGFTYCPDICPASIQKITEVIKVLEKYKIDITPVFITIDPERDTSAMLKEYLKHFNNKFIGLTGTAQQIKEVADKFKVYYAKVDMGPNHAGSYMLDHSSFVYLIDEKGKYIQHFYLNSPQEEIIEYVRVKLNQDK